MCGVGDVTFLTEHFVVEFTEDREVVRSFGVPDLEDFVVDVHVHDRVSSVTEESIVSIKDEIDHFVSCINSETIAEPIDCHIVGAHSVEHEVKFSQVFG